MFRVSIFLVALAFLVLALPVCAQDWSSAKAGVSTLVDCSCLDGAYTWTFTNVSGTPDDGTTTYDVLAWTLEPFNVPPPSHVEAPEGWEWVQFGGWSMFRLADMNRKFAVDGPALEPGESLVFSYTPVPDGPLVNPGGPEGGEIGFVTHIGAVIPADPGSKPVRWQPGTDLPNTQWHETTTVCGGATPEPGGVLTLVLGIGAILCGSVRGRESKT